MEVSSNEVKAGVIIVAGVGVLVLFLVLIFGVDFGEQTKEYTTKLEYVGGIEVGSLVKYGGMDVGSVTKLDFAEQDKSKIRVHIKVKDDTPVRTDSEAYVTSIGIMANQHIELSAGSPDAPLLPSGSELDSKEVLSFTQMAEPMGELSAKVQDLMDQIMLIFDEQNREHFTSMMANMDKILAEGGDQFVNMINNMDQLTANLSTISTDLRELMDSNKGNFDDTLKHLETTTGETSALISEMRTTLKNFETMLSGNSASVVEIMENFQFASQNLEQLSRLLKERPWLLVRKSAPPKRKVE